MSSKKKLEELRQIASPLESDAKSRSVALEKAVKHAENFLHALPERPVYTPPGDRDKALDAMRVSQSPADMDESLAILAEYVDGIGHCLGSSRFFAYIPSGGLYESALADYLAAVTNPYAGVGHAAPGSSRMEETLLRWLAEIIGYPDTSEGDLTSGGGMAALSAIVTARESAEIDSQRVAQCVVYLTSQTHHTLRKALRVSGMGDCIVRQVSVDPGHRMDPSTLEQQIQADVGSGLNPWLIAASAGTTDVGAVDPLNAIADIASQHSLWFHVDAAYGGAFVLCDEGRKRLSGLERSDSLIINPHKGFFLPCGSGVVLVRDGRKLYDAFHARGAYMQDLANDGERSPCDLSPELTRPFRALRFWLPLKTLGSKPFAAALEEKLLLARYFYDEVSAIPGVEVGSRPDLSIVTFRYVPNSGDANAFNQRLVDSIREDGRVFMTSTMISDTYTIRLAILNYKSHLEDVELALTVIKEKICELTEAQIRAK